VRYENPVTLRAVVATLLLFHFGCASTPPREAPPTAADHPPKVAVDGPAATAPPETVLPTAASSPERFVPMKSATHPELDAFYAELRKLQLGLRTDHVRVYFMGDSHAAADFWSGALRSELQARFGNGGPGFIHLGYRDYRHDGVKLDIRGKWRLRPKKPAGIQPSDDGTYSLGGLWLGGYKEAPRVRVELTTKLPINAVTFDFCYRLRKPEDALEVAAVGGSAPKRIVWDANAKPGPQHVVLEGDLAGKAEGELEGGYVFSAKSVGGSPDYCGVSIDSKKPGVVLDTLGINGARYGTALSWDEVQWSDQVKRRPPDLLVLEYGTNEVGDVSPAYEKTGKNLQELVARTKRIAPNAACLVVSATDRIDAEDRVPLMNEKLVAAAKSAGCAYFDAWKHLGGKGALAKLREEPDHLTIKGYRELGKAMASEVLGGFPYR
jgi:lysophospholipase L1-like esterase